MTPADVVAALLRMVSPIDVGGPGLACERGHGFQVSLTFVGQSQPLLSFVLVPNDLGNCELVWLMGGTRFVVALAGVQIAGVPRDLIGLPIAPPTVAASAPEACPFCDPAKPGHPIMLREHIGKMHCGHEDHCEKDPYAEDRCDCGCLRCADWNDWRDWFQYPVLGHQPVALPLDSDVPPVIFKCGL